MVYPCFYYSLKTAKKLDIFIYYTTKEEIPKYNKIKKRISYVRGFVTFVVIIMHLASTLLLATQDNFEFMMRLVEDIALLQTFAEYLLNRWNLDKLINLINEMKSSFSTVEPKIVKNCKRKEKVFYLTFFALLLFGFNIAVIEVFLVKGDEWNLKRAQIYGYKYPQNIVPMNFYLPGGYIDLSAPPYYYIYFCIMPFFALGLTVAACAVYTILGIFSIHMKGQYQLLHRYIKMINHKEIDARGNFKYYTNIVTGQYFTFDPINSNKVTLFTRQTREHTKHNMAGYVDEKTLTVIRHIAAYRNKTTRRNPNRYVHQDNALTREKRGPSILRVDAYNPIYEEHFLKQIIQYQQFLLSFKSKVEKNMRPVVITTCFCFISLIALCTQIVLNSQFKILYTDCIILLNLHLFKLVEFSTNIEDCNRKVLSLMYFDSNWYSKSIKIQRMMNFIILRCQKSEYYSFYGGFVTFDRTLMLSLLNKTYTFINWLLYMK